MKLSISGESRRLKEEESILRSIFNEESKTQETLSLFNNYISGKTIEDCDKFVR